MAKFVGGVAQAGYVDRVRGVDPARCLVVPVDVGKRSGLAVVADHHGEVVSDPVEFTLTRSGTERLLEAIERARTERRAESVHAGRPGPDEAWCSGPGHRVVGSSLWVEVRTSRGTGR